VEGQRTREEERKGDKEGRRGKEGGMEESWKVGGGEKMKVVRKTTE
jgi:hypothetical protein